MRNKIRNLILIFILILVNFTTVNAESNIEKYGLYSNKHIVNVFKIFFNKDELNNNLDKFNKELNKLTLNYRRLELSGDSEYKKFSYIPKTKFKAYEPWHTITSKSSVQYKMKWMYWIDNEGYCRFNSDYVIAVGTAFGKPGNRLKITMSDGKIFNAIIGDNKAVVDTDNLNMQCIHNGSILEFIVDKPTFVKNKNKFIEFQGEVIEIERLSESKELYSNKIDDLKNIIAYINRYINNNKLVFTIINS